MPVVEVNEISTTLGLIACCCLQPLDTFKIIKTDITYRQNRQHRRPPSFSVKNGHISFALLPFRFPAGARWGLL